MVLPATLNPPPLRTDTDGVVRIGGTRVPLETVVSAFDEGAAAEEIALRFPTLDLSDVYATIAYLLQHRPEVDEYLAERREEARRVREEVERRFDTSELRRRLLARRESVTERHLGVHRGQMRIKDGVGLLAGSEEDWGMLR
jgi:uncharacterized protein (DUF433 family)